eukprot:TRINITY_DN332_c0_g1_i1.p1 TRINITY_DN332_c0_g1~~TRINITY_DN332_c0_g1_i1.p1  ORF type:complete len:131 (+),score=40.57 TRINITY_DN332_c0_g1_i1:297-689(+)
MKSLSILFIVLFFVALVSADLESKHEGRCTKDYLEKPADRINKECEGHKLCTKACEDSVCDLVDIFLNDCPEESQSSIELLLTAMDDEYKKDCDEKIPCIPDFFKVKNSSSSLAPSVFLLLASLLAILLL